MTGEYGHAIVIAKLRHCAKFRCTEVLHRIVDGVLGRGGKSETERGKGVPGEKGGQKSERPSYPTARTRRGRRKMKRSQWRLKQERQCAARPEAEARAGATGSDLVILSLAIPPGPLPPVTVPPRCHDLFTLPSSI